MKKSKRAVAGRSRSRTQSSSPKGLPVQEPTQNPELVIITGLSGSGKGTVLKVFEDMGFYAVDNLPIDLIPTFAQLCRQSPDISRAALVVDIREGQALKRFPAIFRSLGEKNPVLLLFLESSDTVLQRTLLHGSSRRMSYHWFFNAGGSPNAT